MSNQQTDEQLRITVAESVEWKYHPTPAGGVRTANWERPDGGWTNKLPNYPNSVDAAMELVREAEKLGFGFLLSNKNGSFQCWLETADCRTHFVATNANPARAICLAWLKLKGVEIK